MGLIMPNTSATVAYVGTIYADAQNVAKASGRELKAIIAESSNPYIKNMGDVKYRKRAFTDELDNHNVASDVDGYIASQAAYTSFCNTFFLDGKKYLLDIKKILKDGTKAEPKSAELSQLGDLLDMILEEQRETNKQLKTMMTFFNTTVSNMALNTEETRQHVQKMGLKFDGIEKKLKTVADNTDKLKTIEIHTGIVSKTWGGVVNSVGDIKARFERWTSR